MGPYALAALVLVSACSSGSSGSPALPVPATSAAPTTQAPVASSSPALPKEVPGQEGGTYFAVFVAVTKSASDPAIAAARSRAQALGYEGGDGEIDCTRGARAQLKLPATGAYDAFSVFFATQADADAAAAAFGSDIAGVAKVTPYCLD